VAQHPCWLSHAAAPEVGCQGGRGTTVAVMDGGCMNMLAYLSFSTTSLRVKCHPGSSIPIFLFLNRLLVLAFRGHTYDLNIRPKTQSLLALSLQIMGFEKNIVLSPDVRCHLEHIVNLSFGRGSKKTFGTMVYHQKTMIWGGVPT
jgi:hypothetical protein